MARATPRARSSTRRRMNSPPPHRASRRSSPACSRTATGTARRPSAAGVVPPSVGQPCSDGSTTRTRGRYVREPHGVNGVEIAIPCASGEKKISPMPQCVCLSLASEAVRIGQRRARVAPVTSEELGPKVGSGGAPRHRGSGVPGAAGSRPRSWRRGRTMEKELRSNHKRHARPRRGCAGEAPGLRRRRTMVTKDTNRGVQEGRSGRAGREQM